MIFVTVGTHTQQFNRLLEKVDELVEGKKIKEEVFAQTGNSSFEPKNFSFKKFLNAAEFEEKIGKSSIVISHGGAGAIISALRHNKPLVVVPRLLEFKEHTNSHQVDLAKALHEKGKAIAVFELNRLENAVRKAKSFSPKVSEERKRLVKALNDFFGEGK